MSSKRKKHGHVKEQLLQNVLRTMAPKHPGVTVAGGNQERPLKEEVPEGRQEHQATACRRHSGKGSPFPSWPQPLAPPRDVTRTSSVLHPHFLQALP